MGEIAVVNWLTLDGVMQGPGREGEDTRGGFTHSGWAAPYSVDAMGSAMGRVLTDGFAWLFGRHTYEGLLASWNEQGGPFKDALNNTTKYVVSGDDRYEPAWPNSVPITGDVGGRISELKTASGGNLVIMGSGVLVNALIGAGLVDRYLLFIAPLVLGSGRRLFTDGTHAALHLSDCTPTTSGAVIASYTPAG